MNWLPLNLLIWACLPLAYAIATAIDIFLNAWDNLPIIHNSGNVQCCAQLLSALPS